MNQISGLAKGLAGAVAGASLGYVAFAYLLKTGFYALALPGFFAGIGATMSSPTRSIWLGVLTGSMGFAIGVFAEWRHAPFVADESLGYFLLHLHQLRWMTWIMLLVGTLAAFWYGRGGGSFRAKPLQD